MNNTLASKGLTLATGDTADLYVGYQCSGIRRSNGMRGAPEVDSWAEWAEPQAPRSPMGHWRLISTIPPRNNSSGAVLRTKP